MQKTYLRLGSFLKIVLILLSIVSIKSLTCGGNCPSDHCDQCPCGSTPSYINIPNYCNIVASLTNATINCCKCIVAQFSKGNQKFVQMNPHQFTRIGVIPYVAQLYDRCAKSPQDLCNYKVNALCVRELFIEYNSWYMWQDQAKACGCPVTSQKDKVILQK